MRGALRRLFGRPERPVYIETRLDRTSYPPPPPPPPAFMGEPVVPDAPAPVEAPVQPSTPGRTPPQVRLIMADGSESKLAADPELAARAEYLVKSMLPPKPPTPEQGGQERPV